MHLCELSLGTWSPRVLSSHVRHLGWRWRSGLRVKICMVSIILLRSSSLSQHAEGHVQVEIEKQGNNFSWIVWPWRFITGQEWLVVTLIATIQVDIHLVSDALLRTQQTLALCRSHFDSHHCKQSHETSTAHCSSPPPKFLWKLIPLIHTPSKPCTSSPLCGAVGESSGQLGCCACIIPTSVDPPHTSRAPETSSHIQRLVTNFAMAMLIFANRCKALCIKAHQSNPHLFHRHAVRNMAHHAFCWHRTIVLSLDKIVVSIQLHLMPLFIDASQWHAHHVMTAGLSFMDFIMVHWFGWTPWSPWISVTSAMIVNLWQWSNNDSWCSCVSWPLFNVWANVQWWRLVFMVSQWSLYLSEWSLNPINGILYCFQWYLQLASVCFFLSDSGTEGASALRKIDHDICRVNHCLTSCQSFHLETEAPNFFDMGLIEAPDLTPMKKLQLSGYSRHICYGLVICHCSLVVLHWVMLPVNVEVSCDDNLDCLLAWWVFFVFNHVLVNTNTSSVPGCF